MFVENLSAFMNVAEFASTVTINGATVSAIFDNASALGSVGQYGMAATQPMLTLASADVPANPVGTSVVANGSNYLVAAHEPDGTGVSRLLLELA
jgi:hypothetical protein